MIFNNQSLLEGVSDDVSNNQITQECFMKEAKRQPMDMKNFLLNTLSIVQTAIGKMLIKQ